MERFLFRKIEVWVLLLLVLVDLLGFIAFGGLILEELQGGKRAGELGKAAVEVAEIPGDIEDVLRGKDPMMVRSQNASPGLSGWSWSRPGGGTGLPGYWLLGHFDVDRQQSLIDMVRLSDGKVVHSWAPDIDALLADAPRTSALAEFANWRTAKFKPYQPWLMANGDLIVKDDHTPLLRIDGCGRKVWRQDATLFHHSTESDGAGGFWIPSVVEPSRVSGLPPRFFDDALTHVAADGRILAQISLPELFLRKDMAYILFPPGVYVEDPLHLNDIQPVLSDGPYWKKGDLFLSLRLRSMVLLYRPSTDEIVWMKEGPWMGQHDVDILDDHRIAVFDNRAQHRKDGMIVGTSDIAVYDFATGAVSRPYHDLMAREQVKSLYEGQFTLLPGGNLIVEDHNSGRVLIFDPQGTRIGEFINRNRNGKVYEIGWGRYIAQADGDVALKALDALDCGGQPGL
ncbi:MAG: hypothetical protein JSR87_05855 [Proteobacteria bacterium]|nr:hypothetical protein [Pseudomonadota bacterium]MBS0571958.1 hypothetical protein [Pseudomonadota bacterium]